MTWLRLAVLAAALSGGWSAAAAQNQDAPTVVSPIQVDRDTNGVNVATGRTTIEGPVLSVPAAPHLSFDRVQNAAPYVTGSISGTGGTAIGNYNVHTGGSASEAFRCVFITCDSATGTGSVYLIDADPNPPDEREYRQAGTGARYYFDVRHYNIVTPGLPQKLQYYASRVVWPNGEVITYTYDAGQHTGELYGRVYRRPNRIASNMGYHIVLTYPVQYMDEGDTPWATPNTATLYRTADNVPLRRFTFNGSTVTDSGSTLADPSDDRTYTCTSCGGTLGVDVEATTGTLQLPGDGSPAVQVTRMPDPYGQLIQTVTRDGVQYTYSYQNLHKPAGNPNWLYDSVTVTGPNGFNRVYDMLTIGSPPYSQFNTTDGVTAVTGVPGSPNPTTSYEIDVVTGRATRVTHPEGNAVSVVYDDAGNVIERTMHRRPGSSTTPATITERAHYVLPPTPQFCDTACWRPDWSRDALQRQTDYRYNTNGQLIQQDEPADAGGLRRRTITGYTLSPNQQQPISRPTSVRVCWANASTAIGACAPGEATLTEFEYVGDTMLVSLQRQRDPVTNAVLETRHSYDAAGRLLSTDGPLPGAGDTSYNRYDAMGQLAGTISADPDGPGWLPYIAVRNSYDPAGRLVKVETGTLSDLQPNAAPSAWTGFNVNRTAETQYAQNRKLREFVREGMAGTVQTLTEYSYDAQGRLECTAVRMNRAAFTFAGTPTACAPNAQGSPPDDGPDRIAKNVYDTLGRRVQLRVGVGSIASGNNVEAAEATWAYNLNGQVTTVIDGNGNRAQLRYDGHLRQDRWTFPSSTPPANRPVPYNDADQATALATAGAVNADDYEEYGYDDAGNRLTLRKRDGSLLGYTYDNLNRLTVKTVPERPSGSQALTAAQTRDVHYGYDIRNLQLFARFDSAAGDGVTNSYDPFGRMLSQRIRMGVTDRMLSYEVREDGARTRITHPDPGGGQPAPFFSYEYDTLGRLNFIRENGGATVPVTIGYAPDGVPGAVVRSNNVITAFGYDNVLRPNLLLHDLNDLTGPSNDVTWSFARNPASGIATQTRNNDTYAWGGHYAANRTYAANGLNQYTTAGPAGFTYDLNGNLVTSPGPNPNETLTYVYDIENRLVGMASSTGASPTVTIFYDPLGRLFSLTASGVTTEFLYDGDALVGEYIWGNQTERYVHGATAADDPLIWYHGNALGDRRSLHADHQGSIVAVSNGSGAMLAINRYDEYGIPAGTNTGRFQYTGQIWLAELGMYYYKARIYSPYLGRFLQTDPVGYDDQYNLYAYVGNDPINAVDPTGLSGCGSRLAHDSASCSGGTLVNSPAYAKAREPTRKQMGSGPGVARWRQENAPRGPHHYDFFARACRAGSDGCTLDTVFEAWRHNSAPGAPYAEAETHDRMLIGDNPIRQHVDVRQRTILNETLPGHDFDYGTVRVLIGVRDSYLGARIIGHGDFGKNSILNQIFGRVIFNYLATRVAYRLNQFGPPLPW